MESYGVLWRPFVLSLHTILFIFIITFCLFILLLSIYGDYGD